MKFDTIDADYTAILQRWVDGSRGNRRKTLKKEVKLFIEACYKITPPNRNFKLSKKLGEIAIRADIKKIFRGARAGAKNTVSDPESLHRSYRKSRGRVKAKLPQKEKHRVVGLNAYIKEMVGRVGWLASGWNRAARKFGTRIPSWIARHGDAGGAYETEGPARIDILITMGRKFASDVYGLPKQIHWAAKFRYWQLAKQLRSMETRSAKEAKLT